MTNFGEEAITEHQLKLINLVNKNKLGHVFDYGETLDELDSDAEEEADGWNEGWSSRQTKNLDLKGLVDDYAKALKEFLRLEGEG